MLIGDVDNRDWPFQETNRMVKIGSAKVLEICSVHE
jgi:hypothetical protein